MIAADPALPGSEELKARIEALNKSRTQATEGTAEQAARCRTPCGTNNNIW
jgi:hypothetical protein